MIIIIIIIINIIIMIVIIIIIVICYWWNWDGDKTSHPIGHTCWEYSVHIFKHIKTELVKKVKVLQ